MKYLLVFFITLISFSCCNFNKNTKDKDANNTILFYSDYIKEGRKLAKAKNYEKAAAIYTEAFREYPDHVQSSDRVDAAYCWMLADKIDSAFFQLRTFVADTNYVIIKITDLTKDKRLAPLQKYPQWKTIIDSMKRNRNRGFPNINSQLADELDEIHYKDQYYRLRLETMQKKYSRGSPEMQKFYKKWQLQDSINLTNVILIIDKYGWLGAEEVGDDGNTTLFLVIQHSDSATQNKYLPLMREAVKNNKASSGELALLEDRVALGQGKRQIYGSQVGYDPITRQSIVLPLEDPENVDKRRASVGLMPLKGYLMMFDITWNPKQYKSYLPYYERNMKLIEKMIDSINVLNRETK